MRDLVPRCPQPGRRGWRTSSAERRLADALGRLERDVTRVRGVLARLRLEIAIAEAT